MTEDFFKKVHKGLEGVMVDETAISKVMPEINSLTYHGYPVQELAEHCRFEEVAYLLWNGELPNKAQLDAFMKEERSNRKIGDSVLKAIKLMPKDCHPMSAIRTAVSFEGLIDPDSGDNSVEAERRKSMRLLAQIPTMVAAFARHRKGQDFIEPRSDLGFGENFFHMCFGKVPAPEVIKAFDVSLILYAEHGFNVSTFTARTIASSLSGMHSAITGAIGSLKGPLHGGANEEVMKILEEIGDPSKAQSWLDKALAEKRLIMGFGHRVYKNGDSRVPTMKKYALKMAEFMKDMKWAEISTILEKHMVEKKNIYPNLDFPTGPAYYLMGFDIDMFTPIFVMARITGWTAHVMEQHKANRLIRPVSKYVGHPERHIDPQKLAANA